MVFFTLGFAYDWNQVLNDHGGSFMGVYWYYMEYNIDKYVIISEQPLQNKNSCDIVTIVWVFIYQGPPAHLKQESETRCLQSAGSPLDVAKLK